MLQKYWAKVEKKAPLIDKANAFYAEWANKFGSKYHGMRHRETGQKHGVLQWNLPRGSIFQGSYKDGKRHGLYIVIQADQVNIGLYRENELLAELAFDIDFQETKRAGDYAELLDDLSPADFASEAPKNLQYVSPSKMKPVPEHALKLTSPQSSQPRQQKQKSRIAQRQGKILKLDSKAIKFKFDSATKKAGLVASSPMFGPKDKDTIIHDEVCSPLGLPKSSAKKKQKEEKAKEVVKDKVRPVTGHRRNDQSTSIFPTARLSDDDDLRQR